MIEHVTTLLGNDALVVLLALLPGLVSVAILHQLTVRETRAPFERVIQALLYTFMSHVIWLVFLAVAGLVLTLAAAIRSKGSNWPWGLANPSIEVTFIGLGATGMGLGIAMAWVINNDHVHKLARRKGISKKSARPNEWYDAFYRWEEYVVVHLVDGRRIYGWPRLYPDNPDEGHLVLQEAEWLRDNDSSATGEPLDSPQLTNIMIPARIIEFVEFVPSENS